MDLNLVIIFGPIKGTNRSIMPRIIKIKGKKLIETELSELEATVTAGDWVTTEVMIGVGTSVAKGSGVGRTGVGVS